MLLTIQDSKHPLFGLSFEQQCQQVIVSTNPHQLFGIQNIQSISDADIKKAYRSLALHFHPDKNRDQPLANQAFAKLSQFYQELLNLKELRSDPNPLQTFFKEFDDIFNTESMNEAEAQEMRAIISSFHYFHQGDKLYQRFKQELTFSYDFKSAGSSQELEEQKQALKTKLKNIWSEYEPQFKLVEAKILYREQDKKLTQLAYDWLEILKRDIDVHSNYRLINIQSKEKFLNDPCTQLDQHWQALIQKSYELAGKAKHQNHYKEAADVAKKLVFQLNQARSDFLQSDDYRAEQNFQARCLQAIKEARPILSKHRGFKQLLADLTINLLIFLSSASLSFVLGKKYRFFTPPTDSSIKIEALKQSIQGFVHLAS